MPNTATKTVAQNKKARFDYELERTLEAGIMLNGGEVKSIKAGHISLAGAFVTIKGGEAWLTNASVTPYQPGQGLERDPTRSRKLLLHKTELAKLVGESQAHRRTIIPTKVYLKNGQVKVEIAVGRSKRQHDKRETLKKRQTERETSRALKQH